MASIREEPATRVLLFEVLWELDATGAATGQLTERTI